MTRPRILAAVLFICSVVLLAGCSSGPKRNAVSGTVKYKDAPIPAGTITFFNEKGTAVGGAAIKNGAFEIPAASGLAAGTYKVTVSYPDPKGVPAVKEGEAPGVGDPSGGGGDGVDPRPVKELLPAKYNRESELKAEIKDGEANTLTFDLK